MVQFKYADSRLSALRMYLGDEDTTVEQELVAFLDLLWEQKVPPAVRDYIERSDRLGVPDKPRDSRKPSARASAQKEPVPWGSEKDGADARDAGENAT